MTATDRALQGWKLSGTFGLDEIEALHECAETLALQGSDTCAAAVSEAACLLDPRNRDTAYMQGVADAIRLFDEEMNSTGDVRNARQAMKTLLRFGPRETQP